MGFFFLDADGTHEVSLCYFVVLGDFCHADRKDGAGALDYVASWSVLANVVG